MYFPDNVAGLTALAERINGFLRHCLYRHTEYRADSGPGAHDPDAKEPAPRPRSSQSNALPP